MEDSKMLEEQKLGDTGIEDSSTRKENKEKKNKKLLGGFLALATVVLMAFLLHRCSAENTESYVTKGDIQASSRKNMQELEQIAEEGMFMIFLNKNVYIDENNKANVLVKNDASNKFDAIVEYYLDDELIYTTDIIKPGYKQEEAEFDYNFEKGTYELKAKFCILAEDGKRLNSVSVPVTIVK